jgi:hypothetical protein
MNRFETRDFQALERRARQALLQAEQRRNREKNGATHGLILS